MHGFCTLHIRILGRHKIDIINNNVHRNEHNLVTLGWRKSLLWNRCFQNLRILYAFARYYRNTKMNFSKLFSKVFKWQNDFMQYTNTDRL